jgi:hypothetical protein
VVFDPCEGGSSGLLGGGSTGGVTGIRGGGSGGPPAAGGKVTPGPYSSTGGHHIHAQSGFKGRPNYNLNNALSISQADMAANNWIHRDMTSTQFRLFKQFGTEVQLGIQRNTMLAHNRIAVQVLEAAGVPTVQARQLVAQSLWHLRSQGVCYPTHIPWVGPNPGTFR